MLDFKNKLYEKNWNFIAYDDFCNEFSLLYDEPDSLKQIKHALDYKGNS